MFENHQYPIFNFGTIFKIKACKSESNDAKGTKIAQPKWLSGHYSDIKAFYCPAVTRYCLYLQWVWFLHNLENSSSKYSFIHAHDSK